MSKKELKQVSNIIRNTDRNSVDVTPEFETMMDEIRQAAEDFTIENPDFAENPFKKITDTIFQVKQETSKEIVSLPPGPESAKEMERLNTLIKNCDEVFSQSEFLEFVRNNKMKFEVASLPKILEQKAEEVLPTIRRVFKLHIADLDTSVEYAKKFQNDLNFKKKTACATMFVLYLKDIKKSRHLLKRIFYMTQTITLIRLSFLYNTVDTLSEKVYQILTGVEETEEVSVETEVRE